MSRHITFEASKESNSLPYLRRPAAEVLVLMDFEGTMGDEMSVRMGDVVKNVTKASEEGWLQGELRGKRGIFPANFATVG